MPCSSVCLGDTQAEPRAEGQSSIRGFELEGRRAVEIVNTRFRLTEGSVPGMPSEARLVLREEQRLIQVIEEAGPRESRVTAAAYVFGKLLDTAAPLWSIDAAGMWTEIIDSAFLAVVHAAAGSHWRPRRYFSLHDGRFLFSATVPPARVYVAGARPELRYAAFAARWEEEAARELKERSDAIGVLTYASYARPLERLVVEAHDPGVAEELVSGSESADVMFMDDEDRILGPYNTVRLSGTGMPTIRLVFERSGRELRIPIRDDKPDPSATTGSPGLVTSLLAVTD